MKDIVAVQQRELFSKALSLFDSKTELASFLGMRPQNLNQYIRLETELSDERFKKLEAWAIENTNTSKWKVRQKIL